MFITFWLCLGCFRTVRDNLDNNIRKSLEFLLFDLVIVTLMISLLWSGYYFGMFHYLPVKY